MKLKYLLYSVLMLVLGLSCLPPSQFTEYNTNYQPQFKPTENSFVEKKENEPQRIVPDTIQSNVKDFFVANEGDYFYLSVELDHLPQFQVNTIDNPDRLYIDLFNTIIEPVCPIEIQEGVIDKIRTGQFDATTARIVIDTYESVGFQQQTEVDAKRIKVYFYSGKQSPPNLIPELPRIAKISPINPGFFTSTYSAKKEITPQPIPTIAQELGLKTRTIIIDPGHGGDDFGAVSPSGLQEKDVVLDIALQLKALLLAEGTHPVVMTREDDRFIPLEERTHFANQNSGDLFLSIHANAHRSPVKTGIETFYLSLASDEDARALAVYENRTAATNYSQLENMLGKILKNTKVEESKNFANFIQNNLVATLHQESRGVKKAGFVVLIGADMPSVLAEVGFLTNSKEERLLSDNRYRKMAAQALFNGIKEYTNLSIAFSDNARSD